MKNILSRLFEHECDCGYRCGGPGRCDLSIRDCQQQGHYVRDPECAHVFEGATCECGVSVAAHDLKYRVAHIPPPR